MATDPRPPQAQPHPQAKGLWRRGGVTVGQPLGDCWAARWSWLGFTRGWVKQRILWRRLDCSVVIEVMAEEVWPADEKHTMQAEGVQRRGDQEFLFFFFASGIGMHRPRFPAFRRRCGLHYLVSRWQPLAVCGLCGHDGAVLRTLPGNEVRLPPLKIEWQPQM